MKLYDLPMQFSELEQALVESEGELTPELEKRFDDFLRGGKEKIEAGAMVLRHLEAEAEACLKEAKRLKDRQASFENNVIRLKSMMLIAVDAAFAGKVKTSLFTVWGQTSAPGIGIELQAGTDLAELHARTPELIKTKYELDKEAVKQAALDGKALPGEISVFDVPGTRFLRIR